MDGRAFFTGAIDEVRVWDRALTDGEVAGLRTAGAPQGTVLSLPMDTVRPGG
jgi:sialidase-1